MEGMDVELVLRNSDLKKRVHSSTFVSNYKCAFRKIYATQQSQNIFNTV
ncbi:hypothetical protein ABIE61_001058 [Marinobacterium sp. MBR-111]|jgi:hypothetical protein